MYFQPSIPIRVTKKRWCRSWNLSSDMLMNADQLDVGPMLRSFVQRKHDPVPKFEIDRSGRNGQKEMPKKALNRKVMLE
jgi:hypothetical protein